MREIIWMEPVFKSMIWGGSRLASEFGYNILDGHTGECWAISAHPNGDCMVNRGTYQGNTLSGLWRNHRELFGNMEGEVFPLLVKIIDAQKDLSIQVHPDNEYAAKYEQGALGKTECWYILDCPEEGKIVLGHNARNKQELKEMIEQDRWEELIRHRNIRKGDFLQIEPGTVHAIKAGTMLLETQQSSDITYRLYDYGRLENGKPRQLHIKQSIDVIRCPHEDYSGEGDNAGIEEDGRENLVQSKYYTVNRLWVQGGYEGIQDKNFMNLSVIEGQGRIDGTEIRKGDHCILPYGYGAFHIEGNMKLIQSYVN